MARPGGKPKPTALHRLHGTGHATRMKARRNEPLPEGCIGPAPDYFSAEQKTDWEFVIRNSPAGVLTACDRAALEVFLVARDHHRIANQAQQALDKDNALPLLTQTTVTMGKKGNMTGGGNIIQSPYLGIMSSAGQRMLRAAAELGFTPASRPRLSGSNYDPAMTPTRQAPRQSREPTSGDLDKLMRDRERLN